MELTLFPASCVCPVNTGLAPMHGCPFFGPRPLPVKVSSDPSLGRLSVTFLGLLSDHVVQELCESRGGRPGLSILTSLLVSVDVKLY